MDPRFHLDPDHKEILCAALEMEYNFGIDIPASLEKASQTTGPDVFHNYFWEQEKKKAGGNPSGQDDEVDKYFWVRKDPENIDALEFWKKHETTFLTISRMAQDYLGAQASLVAAKSTWSISGELVTEVCSSLKDKTIKACMLGRSWIKSPITDEGNI